MPFHEDHDLGIFALRQDHQPLPKGKSMSWLILAPLIFFAFIGLATTIILFAVLYKVAADGGW